MTAGVRRWTELREWRKRARYWAAPVLLCALAGCGYPTADFGRGASSVIHDEVYPAVGNLRALANREPVSNLNYADEELEMRDRVWRYIRAPHTKDWAHNFASEMHRTRISVPNDHNQRPENYYYYLRSDRYRSSPVRYARLSADIGADSSLAPKVFGIICKVLTIDKQREIAAKNLKLNDAKWTKYRRARRTENLDFISWFARAMRFRLNAYDYALAHLLIETPHVEARMADRQYQILLPLVERAERGEFCVGEITKLNKVGVTAIPSRYSKASSMSKKDQDSQYLK